MEIKIKDKDNLIYATIEVVDGVLVVSPKEEKYEPKDGDVVTYFNDDKPTVYIYKSGHKYNTSFYAAYSSIRKKCYICTGGHLDMNRNDIRFATEKEKQKLFDKLKEEGYEWDANKKELVKLKWKPKCNETFYYPLYECGYFESDSDVYLEDDKDLIDEDVDVVRGWAFRTKEECEQFCKKLNKAIEGIKP